MSTWPVGGGEATSTRQSPEKTLYNQELENGKFCEVEEERTGLGKEKEIRRVIVPEIRQVGRGRIVKDFT